MDTKMNELYVLLEDCHTALAKSTLKNEQYNSLSERLINAKQELVKANVGGFYSLKTVKAAFDTFRFKGFPHNEPEFDDWLKKYLDEAIIEYRKESIPEVKIL